MKTNDRSHLNREKLARAIQYVSDGNVPEIATRAVGIGSDGFHWLWTNGNLSVCPGGVAEADWQIARWFVQEVSVAEARFEAETVRGLVKKGGADTMRELLGSRFGDRWGKREKKDVSVNSRVRVDFSTMSEDQLLARLKEIGFAPDGELEGEVVLGLPGVKGATSER